MMPSRSIHLPMKIQEAYRTPNRLDQKRNSSQHIIIRTTNSLNKDKILKAVREKGQVTYKGRLMRITIPSQTFNYHRWRNRNIPQQNQIHTLWGTIKVFLRGKLITLSVSKNKLERAQTSSLTTHVKALEQKEANSHKRSRQQEIIKLRGKINQVETRRTIQRINQMRSWFSEKINKIDKPLARLTRRHRDNILINKIRNEKGDITTDPEELQNTIRSFYKRLYSTKLEKLDEIDKFLDRYQVPKLNHDQVNDLKSTLSPKEIEAVINSLPTKKGPDGFSAEFYQTFKKNVLPVLHKLFHKIEAEGTLPNSFYEAPITLMPKPQKNPTKIENFRPISLMNIDAKVLNKILANQIQEHNKKIIHADHVSFITGMQRWFNIQKSINVIHYIKKHKTKPA
jgi:hypothetical protein